MIVPEHQHKGYDTRLLRFAVSQCASTPTLWILVNNNSAEAFYAKAGFMRTGSVHSVPGVISEIELSLK